MSPYIRPATALDLEAMAAMREAAWHESYSELVPEEVLEWLDARRTRTIEGWQEMLLDGTYFWIATEGDEIVGLAQAGPSDEEDIGVLLEINMLYVRNKMKGSGLADALLKTTIGDADAYAWVLEGNDRAISFYRRHGFEPDDVKREVQFMPPTMRERRLVRRAAAD